MFEQGRKVWWPLEWREYDEHGSEQTRRMTVLFAIHSRAEREAAKNSALSTMLVDANRRLREISNALTAGAEPETGNKSLQEQLDEQLATIARVEREQLADVAQRVHDWRLTVADEPVPFSRETLDQMLSYPDFAGLFARGLADASRGALAKN